MGKRRQLKSKITNRREKKKRKKKENNNHHSVTSTFMKLTHLSQKTWFFTVILCSVSALSLLVWEILVYPQLNPHSFLIQALLGSVIQSTPLLQSSNAMKSSKKSPYFKKQAKLCCKIPSNLHMQESWLVMMSIWLHHCDTVFIFVDDISSQLYPSQLNSNVSSSFSNAFNRYSRSDIRWSNWISNPFQPTLVRVSLVADDSDSSSNRNGGYNSTVYFQTLSQKWYSNLTRLSRTGFNLTFTVVESIISVPLNNEFLWQNHIDNNNDDDYYRDYLMPAETDFEFWLLPVKSGIKQELSESWSEAKKSTEKSDDTLDIFDKDLYSMYFISHYFQPQCAWLSHIDSDSVVDLLRVKRELLRPNSHIYANKHSLMGESTSMKGSTPMVKIKTKRNSNDKQSNDVVNQTSLLMSTTDDRRRKFLYIGETKFTRLVRRLQSVLYNDGPFWLINGELLYHFAQHIPYLRFDTWQARLSVKARKNVRRKQRCVRSIQSSPDVMIGVCFRSMGVLPFDIGLRFSLDINDDEKNNEERSQKGPMNSRTYWSSLHQHPLKVDVMGLHSYIEQSIKIYYELFPQNLKMIKHHWSQITHHSRMKSSSNKNNMEDDNLNDDDPQTSISLIFNHTLNMDQLHSSFSLEPRKPRDSFVLFRDYLRNTSLCYYCNRQFW